jgi:hypothetical protein
MERLLEVSGASAQLRQPVNHILGQMEAVHFVEYHYVEGRRRCARQ